MPGTEVEADLEFSLSEVSLLMKMLTQAYQNLRLSPIEALPLEIAVADFYNERKKSVS